MPNSGNACFRLHSAMRSLGFDSNVLTIIPSVKRNNVYTIKQNAYSFIQKAYSILSNYRIKKKLKPEAYFYSNLPLIGARISSERIVKDADVVYLHWIAGGSLKLKEIEKIASKGKLVILFMHDMWDFTGGCHHSFNCSGYESGCKKCAMFIHSSSVSSKQIKFKKELYSKYPNIIFISPSKWMAEKAKKSDALQSSKVHIISNVVDEKIFKPINKTVAKEILNLPQDKKIITFGCQAGTTNPFKGWLYLERAIKLLKDENLHILVYGSDYNKETQEQISYPITFLGPVYDETKLSLICNATDVFVSPSLAESFGLTFLENILCGTPVVGFNNTAIGELIKTDINGYLAKNMDSEDLALGIKKMLSFTPNPCNRNEYSSEKIVLKHIQIIKEYQNKF